MNEREFEQLKVGDLVRDPNERGPTTLYVVENKTINKVPRIEGTHRYMTVREQEEEGSAFFKMPSFIIQNAELETWERVSLEEAKVIKLLYEGDRKSGSGFARSNDWWFPNPSRGKTVRK